MAHGSRLMAHASWPRGAGLALGPGSAMSHEPFTNAPSSFTSLSYGSLTAQGSSDCVLRLVQCHASAMRLSPSKLKETPSLVKRAATSKSPVGDKQLPVRTK